MHEDPRSKITLVQADLKLRFCPKFFNPWSLNVQLLYSLEDYFQQEKASVNQSGSSNFSPIFPTSLKKKVRGFLSSSCGGNMSVLHKHSLAIYCWITLLNFQCKPGLPLERYIQVSGQLPSWLKHIMIPNRQHLICLHKACLYSNYD